MTGARRALYAAGWSLLGCGLLAGTAPREPAPARAQGVYGKSHAPAKAAEPAPEPEDYRPPHGQVLAAYHDLLAGDAARHRHVRYLDLGNLPAGERGDAAKVLSGWLNGLSRRPVIARPAAVSGTALSLLRVRLDDYGLDPAAWDRVIAEDVVYHARERESYEYPDPSNAYAANYRDHHGERQYRAADGQYYRVGTYHRERQVDAPWLTPTDGHAEALRRLHDLTGSAVPLVRANVWIRNAAAVEGRTPGYYALLGVRSLDDWLRLCGSDGRSSRVVRAAQALSGVTQQPRAYKRLDADNGGVWFSIDFRLAVKERNPLRVFGERIERFADGFEVIGHNPCGMQLYAATDGKKVLQDKAPDFLANAPRSPRNSTAVHVGYRCCGCHSQGGYNAIEDWPRALYAETGEPLKVDRVFREEYLVPLGPVLEADRARYEAAVRQATGWAVAEYAGKVLWLWEWDEDLRVDLAQAARETGYPPEVLRTALQRAYARGEEDAALEGLLRGLALPPRQFEDEYDKLQDYVARFYP